MNVSVSKRMPNETTVFYTLGQIFSNSWRKYGNVTTTFSIINEKGHNGNPLGRLGQTTALKEL